MATVTLYDGKTGTPVAGDGPAHPDPIVSADDHSKVTFVLDPRSGTSLVQFVADPGRHRLVAALDLADGDGLPDLYRAIQERVAASDFHMAPPGGAPPHLNVFHYLAAPDPASPDAEIRAHVVATDDPIEVGVPSAAEAASVVAFFHQRAPWKVVAVHAPAVTVSREDADVTVVVDGTFDEVTYIGRDETWTDEDAVPERSDGPAAGSAGADSSAGSADADTGAPADPGTADTAEAGTASSHEPGAVATTDEAGATTADADGRETPSDEPPVLRIYDGTTGELQYDSRTTGDVPANVHEDAKRLHRDGLALFVDPDAGVLRAILRARGTGVDTEFVVEYDRHGPDGNLPASFAAELAERVDDLGVEFSVVVAGEDVDFDELSSPATRRPEAFTDVDSPVALSAADLEWLRRVDRPLDFAAPSGTAAFEVATLLRGQVGDDPSVAICAAGRTDDLAGIDVVVTPDADCETIEPRGETATALADRRLQERLTDVAAAIEAMVGRVDDVTGTIEARQRVFAAAMSGGVLASRGFTVVPVDDRPIGRRRRQARYLVLYALLLAGLAGGAHTGQFDPLTALLSGTYRFKFGPVAGSPLAAFQRSSVVDGGVVVGSSLAAIVAGAYWLLGHPMGPLAAARSLVETVWRQITGGAGSGTVPSTVGSLADSIQDSLIDVEAAYVRLEGSEGTTASRSGDFGAFVEQQLLAHPVVPAVRVVRRSARWRQLLVGVAAGVLVGTVSAGAILGALWLGVRSVQTDPTLALRALLGVVVLLLLASAAKGVAIRYGRGRPPRWSTTR